MEHFYRNIQGWFSFPRTYRSAIKSVPDGGTLVEVGSWRGKSFAFLVVESINSGRQHDLVAIDPWRDEMEGSDGTVKLGSDEVFEDFLGNLRPVKGHFRVLRTTSLEGAEHFEDGSIDFLFIDASHAYEDVLNDLKTWYPKIRTGGLVAGHDYHWPEVRRAVSTFCASQGLRRPLPVELCWTFRIGPDERSLRARLARATLLPLDLAIYGLAWIRLMLLRRTGRRPSGEEFYRE